MAQPGAENAAVPPATGAAAAEGDEKAAVVVDGPIVCPGHSRPVPFIAFSAVVDDRVFLTSGCLDGNAMLRDGETGDWIGTFEGHKGAVWACRLNHDTTRAVTASADYSAILWDALTGDVLHKWEHKAVVRTAAFSSDGAVVLTAQDKTIRIFDVASTEQISEYDKGFAVQNLVAGKDPQLVYGSGRSKEVFAFDRRANSAECILTCTDEVTNVTLSFDGAVLAVSAGKTVYFVDAASLLKSYTLGLPVSCVSIDPNRRQFVTGSSAELWAYAHSLDTGRELACNKGHHGPVRCIEVSPRGNVFASGSEDGTIRIWDYPKEVEASAAP